MEEHIPLWQQQSKSMQRCEQRFMLAILIIIALSLLTIAGVAVFYLIMYNIFVQNAVVLFNQIENILNRTDIQSIKNLII